MAIRSAPSTAPASGASRVKDAFRLATRVTDIPDEKIVSFVLLFLHRADLMRFLFNDTSMMNQGFLFNAVWPMLWLVTPWVISVGLVCVILEWLGNMLHRMKANHPVVFATAVVLAVITAGAFAYDHYNPGFVNGVVAQATAAGQQVIAQISNPVEEAAASGMEADQTETDRTEADQMEADREEKKETAMNIPSSAAAPAQPEPEKTEGAEASAQYRVSRDKGLTVRESCSMNGNVVTHVNNGEKVTVLEKTSVWAEDHHWIRVRTQKDQTGWVLEEYLVSASQEETDSHADEPVLFAVKTEAEARYSDMTFTVRRISDTQGVLTIESRTKQTWKFAPWVGFESTVMLRRADGTESFALIGVEDMFYKYHTSNFDRGRTFTFDLNFEGGSDANWKEVEVSLASFMKTHDVRISFK